MIDFSQSPFEAERVCQGCRWAQYFEPDTLACMHPKVAVPSVVKAGVVVGVNVIPTRRMDCKGDWFEARS